MNGYVIAVDCANIVGSTFAWKKLFVLDVKSIGRTTPGGALIAALDIEATRRGVKPVDGSARRFKIAARVMREISSCKELDGDY